MKKFIIAAAALAALSTAAFADADSYSKSLISTNYGTGFYATSQNQAVAPEAFTALDTPVIAGGKSADFQRLFEKSGSYSWTN
jgi:hypothetical protein